MSLHDPVPLSGAIAARPRRGNPARLLAICLPLMVLADAAFILVILGVAVGSWGWTVLVAAAVACTVLAIVSTTRSRAWARRARNVAESGAVATGTLTALDVIGQRRDNATLQPSELLLLLLLLLRTTVKFSDRPENVRLMTFDLPWISTGVLPGVSLPPA
ncbi:hypothetical protein [Glaciihabitans sp. UYNi722]|uniref:hypothetical protein n=1 Tax=Glaciihabitans sp. UYNi722 TaxID=3156344 RepID=UPI0033983F06